MLTVGVKKCQLFAGEWKDKKFINKIFPYVIPSVVSV